jgi:hypothetical protein
MISILLSAVLTAAASKQERPAPPASGLFSRRAMRNARLLIEIRMLELRDERLECLRRILLRRLPPDLVTGEPGATVKQSSAPHATTDRSEDCAWVSNLPRRRSPAG